MTSSSFTSVLMRMQSDGEHGNLTHITVTVWQPDLTVAHFFDMNFSSYVADLMTKIVAKLRQRGNRTRLWQTYRLFTMDGRKLSFSDSLANAANHEPRSIVAASGGLCLRLAYVRTKQNSRVGNQMSGATVTVVSAPEESR